MKKIKLTRNKSTVVNNIDYKYLIQWKWHVMFNGRQWYAIRTLSKPSGKKVLMHRVILERMGFKNFKQGDHKDGNGLNNKRRNLRPATVSQNQYNRGKPINNTSGFKGVSWSSQKQKWRSRIYINGKDIHLGFFNDKEIAAKVHSQAVLKYHKQFSHKIRYTRIL